MFRGAIGIRDCKVVWGLGLGQGSRARPHRPPPAAEAHGRVASMATRFRHSSQAVPLTCGSSSRKYPEKLLAWFRRHDRTPNLGHLTFAGGHDTAEDL